MTIDSSTAARPARTLPSTGIASPGLTRSRSPTATSASGTSLSTPSRTRRAIFGARSSSLRTAADVRLARPGLEVAPEQDEREDHADGLVVHVPHRSRRDRREGRRKEGRGQREPERGRRADRDERVHVGGAVAQGPDGPRKKRRSGPEVDRQREGEQHPVAARKHDVGHRDDGRRNRQGGGDERAPQDVPRLGAGARLLVVRARVERGARVVAARPDGGDQPGDVQVRAAHVGARRSRG